MIYRGKGLEAPPLVEPLDQIDTVQPLDLIADAFMTSERQPVRVDGVRLGDALSQIASLYHHRWWLEDGFVMMRSRYYGFERFREPPMSLLERFIAHSDHGEIDLDDLGQVAALPDYQFNMVLAILLQGWSDHRADPLYLGRGDLLFWNALTPAQRGLARGPGLAYDMLAPALKRMFALAAAGRLTLGSSPSAPGKMWTSEELRGAMFRIAIQDAKGWGYRNKTSALPEIGASPEACLRWVRTLAPEAKLSDIVPIQFSGIQFDYVTPGSEGAKHMLSAYWTWPTDKAQ